MTSPNMVLRVIGNIMVVLHNARAPSETEWQGYLDALSAMNLDELRSLVFTVGGAPNGAQRLRLNEVLGGRQVLGAVVSPNAIVRGVVTALSWFNSKIKAFSPSETGRALDYIGIAPHERDRVWSVIGQLRRELGDDHFESLQAEG